MDFFKYALEVLAATLSLYKDRKEASELVLKTHTLLFQTSSGRFFIRTLTGLLLMLCSFLAGITFNQTFAKGYPAIICFVFACLIAAAPLPTIYVVNKDL
jgi:hypothetical protein